VAITRDILDGRGGPARDIAMLNAAGALVAAGKAKDLTEGLELAARAIDSGGGADKLEALIEFTNKQ